MSFDNMPTPLKLTFTGLFQEVKHVHYLWNQYRKLYDKDRQTVDLLNELAAAFFAPLQSVLLFNGVLLGIAKLTDPAETVVKDPNGNKKLENLTLRLMGTRIDPILTTAFANAMTKVDQECEFARKARNKSIAHNDWIVFQNPSLIFNFSYDDVSKALISIAKVMNIVQHHYEGTETGYEYTSFGGSDADALLGWLRFANDNFDASREVQINN